MSSRPSEYRWQVYAASVNLAGCECEPGPITSLRLRGARGVAPTRKCGGYAARFRDDDQYTSLRQRSRSHQELIDGAGAEAPLPDRPDDERLAAAHVAG